ncbi:signal transduction histidine kinase [Nocardioides ginsengisegetis]|uniref:histidine kinase n=1 Tax=Nocardioides ginsengisegetis TaxID=661491 RepID=A0A7W3P992_9ACTN|nr:signal transduction histidine kinase [Nocardioides ginsengisegetis]
MRTVADASPWRVTTAVRVFALATAVGQLVSADTLGIVGVVALQLGCVAAVCSALELTPLGRRLPWVTVLEGVAVVGLLGLANGPVEPLLVYLAVPTVVAGVRHGALATVNTSLSTAMALLAIQALTWSHVETGPTLGSVLPWLVLGLGAGMLASHQTQSVRRLEAVRAPYAAANRLVGTLHSAATDLPQDLDVILHSRALECTIRPLVGADASAVLVRSGLMTLETLTSYGDLGVVDDELARRCMSAMRAEQRGTIVALPLRVGEHVFGALLLTCHRPLANAVLASIQEQVDERAILLDTAVLLDGVRSLATNEERNRLARDIHDGVAQQIVALGYLADDLAALSHDPDTRQGAEDLRVEVTRLVNALRFSVFDLRQDVADAGSLSGALSDYAGQLGTHSDLRIHLTLDERGSRLTRRTEEELLRIAQEAIANVHKHAHAVNVWVRLEVHGTDATLVVADDGVGGATSRPGHYGLHTMRERALRIDADLEVGPRCDGGTVVTLMTRREAPTGSGPDSTTTPRTDGRHSHGDHHLAGR